MKTIDEHIQKDESEIQEAKAQGNESKLHHLEDELNSLKEYKEHHPDDKHDPNALNSSATLTQTNLNAWYTTIR